MKPNPKPPVADSTARNLTYWHCPECGAAASRAFTSYTKDTGNVARIAFACGHGALIVAIRKVKR